MGLGDEAGISLREQRAAAEEAERNYRAHIFSSVPSAIMRW
ncbi:hypothetical protein PUN71_022230 [Arthrobacter sp. NQ7]|nr:hypothetical protein [Arthrobacter sp. NQ7]MDJ0459929.1 hypothetical protein [Arthrobacter sp. NQ7]